MRHFAQVVFSMVVFLLCSVPGIAQTPTPTLGSADMDGNGCVDSKDLLLFITDWCAAVHAKSVTADLDGDGSLDPDDFFLFPLAWQQIIGPTPTATSTATEASTASPTPSSTIPSASIEMVTIPSGSFFMGNTGAVRDECCECCGCLCETPRHLVTFNYAFQLGKYEVTNLQYAKALNYAKSQGYLSDSSNQPYAGGDVYQNGRLLIAVSSFFCDIAYIGHLFLPLWLNNEWRDNHPANEITWFGAVACCNWLSEMNGLPPAYDLINWSLINRQGGGYRLPSESEWEYACRGTPENPHRYDPFSFGDDPALDLTSCNSSAILSANMVWCGDDNGGATKVVGSKPPNDYGLYDMHGNIWEWCEDWHHSSYVGAPVDGSPWLVQEINNARRVRRCGSSLACLCRSAARDPRRPETFDNGYGLRIARKP